MATISEQQTTQVNITIVPKSPVNLGLVPSDGLGLKITEIYGDSSKPVLTKFPDVFVLFDPNNQIAINVLSESNRIIVSDNRVTPYASRNLDKFVQFTKSAVDMILEKTKTDGLIAYGLNIMAVIDIDQKDSSKFLLEKFIKQEGGVAFIGGGVKLIFEANGGDKCRNDLRLDPRFGPKLTPTKSIQVNQNSHFEADSLPALELFNGQVIKVYNELSTLLGKIL